MEPNDEELRRVRYIGMHPRRWAELKMLLPEKVPEGRRLPVFFGLLEGMSVIENVSFPEDRVGLFDKDMVLIAFLRLGADHEAGKKDGVIFGGNGIKRSDTGTATD